jgi:hypothetical protein
MQLGRDDTPAHRDGRDGIGGTNDIDRRRREVALERGEVPHGDDPETLVREDRHVLKELGGVGRVPGMLDHGHAVERQDRDRPFRDTGHHAMEALRGPVIALVHGRGHEERMVDAGIPGARATKTVFLLAVGRVAA